MGAAKNIRISANSWETAFRLGNATRTSWTIAFQVGNVLGTSWTIAFQVGNVTGPSWKAVVGSRVTALSRAPPV
jgi:hypothetical protein